MNKTHNNDSVCRDDGKYKYKFSNEYINKEHYKWYPLMCET